MSGFLSHTCDVLRRTSCFPQVSETSVILRDFSDLQSLNLLEKFRESPGMVLEFYLR